MSVDQNKDRVKLDNIPKMKEDYISLAYGYHRFFDSYRFLSIGLDGLVKTLDNNDFEILKKRNSR